MIGAWQHLRKRRAGQRGDLHLLVAGKAQPRPERTLGISARG